MLKKLKELNLSKIDYLTIIMFLVGYLFILFDEKFQNPMEQIVKTMSNGYFAFYYVVLFFFIFLSVRLLMREAKRYTEYKPKYYPIKSLFLGSFLGFITSISNVFILSLFSRF